MGLLDVAPVNDKRRRDDGDDRSWSPVDMVRDLLFERRYFWQFTTLFLLGEAMLGLLIIWKIPYTKIDWPAYMQQVDGFLSGERDYSKLEGDTGPLVYPALHLYLYTALHELLPAAERVRPAQYVFLGLYLATIALVAFIYRRARAPQALLVPLALSKRAHSIFLLRLFNDPWSMALFYGAVAAIMAGGRTGWRAGSVLYSLALGVKMNILNFLPALLVLLFQYRGVKGTVESVAIIAAIQLALPLPFFLSDASLARAYFTSAFDFSRQFLHEWTVNWRLVPTTLFNSRAFASSLLAAQLTALVVFAWYRWNPVAGGTPAVLRQAFRQWSKPAADIQQFADTHIPAVLFTANIIGMAFARSLHYQFYSWYFHQIPLLLYLGGAWGSVPLGISLWGLIEYAWSTAPSTILSSAVLSIAHAIILSGLFFRDSSISGRMGLPHLHAHKSTRT